MQEMEEAEALAQRNANLVHAITYQVPPLPASGHASARLSTCMHHANCGRMGCGKRVNIAAQRARCPFSFPSLPVQEAIAGIYEPPPPDEKATSDPAGLYLNCIGAPR